VNADRAAKWASTRVQGRSSFIWRVGVLQWGLVMFGAMGGSQAAQHPSRWLLILALNIPIWLCAGILFGILTWHLSERGYAKYLAKQGQAQTAV
jgi:hypothetical protein